MSEVDNAARELVLDATGIRPLGPGASLVWHYLHDQEHTEIFSGGSAGPGKTFNGCLFDVTEALRLKGSAGAMFRSTAENLRKSTIVTYFEVCQKARLQDGVHYKFNESKGLLRWIGGSTTDFDYLKFEPRDPNYSRLGGRQYTRAVLDEIDEVEERAVDVLSSRIRYKLTHWCHSCAATDMAIKSKPVDCDDDGLPIQWECYACGTWTKGVLPKLLGTGNPGDYWTKYRYVFDKDGNPVTLQPHQARVLMLLDDNPDKAHVSTYRQQLEKNPDDYDKERLLKGNWNAVRKTGREFLYAFSTQKHVWSGSKRVAYDPDQPLHITWDFNSAPYITLLVAQIHIQPDNRFHVAFLREFCLKHPESNPTAACKALLRAMKVPEGKEAPGPFAGHDKGLYFYGDRSGKNADLNARDGIRHAYDTIRKELRLHTHNGSDRVVNKNPSHIVVRDFQNSALRGERKFYLSFDPSMVNTIADHLNVKEGADGKILKVYETDHVTGVRYEKWGHCLQASYYLTCGAFPKEFQTFIRR